MAYVDHLGSDRSSSRFCPPHHYWLSLAGISSLLRDRLPPRTASFRLEFPLVLLYPFGTIRGFPSYCKHPVNSAILKHPMGLIRYRASPYFAGLPTHWAESGLLALCAVHLLSLPSDPTLAGDALAIRIVFPLIGATPASFSRPGLFAPLGKQKKAAEGLAAWREVPYSMMVGLPVTIGFSCKWEPVKGPGGRLWQGHPISICA